MSYVQHGRKFLYLGRDEIQGDSLAENSLFPGEKTAHETVGRLYEKFRRAAFYAELLWVDPHAYHVAPGPFFVLFFNENGFPVSVKQVDAHLGKPGALVGHGHLEGLQAENLEVPLSGYHGRVHLGDGDNLYESDDQNHDPKNSSNLFSGHL